MPEELTSNYRSARRWSRVGSVALYAVSALVVALVLARTVGGVSAHGPRAAAALVPEAVSELPLVAATVLLAEFLRHVGGTGAPFGRAQRVRLLAASLAIAAKSVLDVALPLVALGMTAVLLVASLLMDTVAASGRASAFAQVGTEAVTVMPGDSLWSLAEEHPVDGASTAEVVDFISQENGLSSSSLSIGQSVYVPVS